MDEKGLNRRSGSSNGQLTATTTPREAPGLSVGTAVLAELPAHA
jgi:hypothetical protein